jgi:hypothetical protein
MSAGLILALMIYPLITFGFGVLIGDMNAKKGG